MEGSVGLPFLLLRFRAELLDGAAVEGVVHTGDHLREGGREEGREEGKEGG